MGIRYRTPMRIIQLSATPPSVAILEAKRGESRRFSESDLLVCAVFVRDGHQQLVSTFPIAENLPNIRVRFRLPEADSEVVKTTVHLNADRTAVH